MGLKVMQRIESANGEYGKLAMEVVRNGEEISVTIRAKGGLIEGPKPLKYHFVSLEEMQDLSACLVDAVAYLGGK